jgi:hypothetical protein
VGKVGEGEESKASFEWDEKDSEPIGALLVANRKRAKFAFVMLTMALMWFHASCFFLRQEMIIL